jgi:hypothetical protein
VSSLLSFYESVFKQHGAVVLLKTETEAGALYGLNYRGVTEIGVEIYEKNARFVVFRSSMTFFDVPPELRQHLLEKANEANNKLNCVKFCLLPDERMPTAMSRIPGIGKGGGKTATTLEVGLELIVAKPEDVRELFDLFFNMVYDAHNQFSEIANLQNQMTSR